MFAQSEQCCTSSFGSCCPSAARVTSPGCRGSGNGRAELTLPGRAREGLVRSRATVEFAGCRATGLCSISTEREAGALSFASGTDQLTEEKRADISHCFPVIHTHTHTEETERGILGIPRHMLAHHYHPRTRLHTKIYVTIHKAKIPADARTQPCQHPVWKP